MNVLTYDGKKCSKKSDYDLLQCKQQYAHEVRICVKPHRCLNQDANVSLLNQKVLYYVTFQNLKKELLHLCY